MKRFRIFTAILMLCASSAKAETLPALHDVTGVAADDVLNIRAAPNANAEIMGQLAPNATGVEVTAQSPDGRWGRVNSAEASGWASLRYLARQPGPDWTALTQPMTCGGTEPFWSLGIDPVQGNLVLHDIDNALTGLSVDWQSDTQGMTGIIGLAVSNAGQSGFATLQAAECSDGMSDRLSGIALTLFLKGSGAAAETKGYAGCCSLNP